MKPQRQVLHQAASSGSSGRPPFEASYTRDGDRCTLRVIGELDLSVSPELEAVAAQALADARAQDGPPSLLVLDLSGLTFIDSAGLRCVLVIREQAVMSRCAFGMVRGPASIQRLFAIAGVADDLPWLGDPGPRRSPDPPGVA